MWRWPRPVDVDALIALTSSIAPLDGSVADVVCDLRDEDRF